MSNMPILSFFSGGGFLDIGFEKAGFSVVWANEFMESYAEIYLHGLASWRQAAHSKNGSDFHMNLDSIDKLSKSIILAEAFGSVSPKIFGMIGGPPCQDFSHSGRNLGVNGDRGKYTGTYVDIICELQPSFFVMENVPGLYKKKHRKQFDQLVFQLENNSPGYITSAKIVSALSLGIPQDRDRLFLIGFRKDLLPQDMVSKTLMDRSHTWFRWPVPVFENAKSLDWPQTNLFGIHDVMKPDNVPDELMVNDLVQDDAEQLPNGRDSFHPYSEKFKRIAEGDVSGKSFKRLHRYRYSPTVWYGNNEVHLHPWKPRRLTVREALRIQTVPDEYVMPSHSTLTDKFRVISNGVPTRMAQRIAISVSSFLSHYVDIT